MLLGESRRTGNSPDGSSTLAEEEEKKSVPRRQVVFTGKREKRLLTESGEEKMFDALDYESHKSSFVNSSFRIPQNEQEYHDEAEYALKISGNESTHNEESRRTTASVLQDRTSILNHQTTDKKTTKSPQIRLHAPSSKARAQ